MGLEFTRQWLKLGSTVATCRNPEKAMILKELKTRYRNKLVLVSLYVSAIASIHNTLAEVKKLIEKLGVLINNAGIISGAKTRSPHLGELYKEDLVRVFKVNAIGPLLVTETFLPLLEKSKRAVIANISSQMGSITLKSSGGYYSYSSSKAALNMISKLLSFDLKHKRIIVLNFHLGWVKTDMGGVGAPLEPQLVVEGMINIIKKATMADSGRFINWQWQELPY